MSKQILILGAGPGGLTLANLLRKKLSPEHKIIVIDKNRYHSLGLTYLWVMLGLRKREQVLKDLTSLSEKGLNFVQANINKIYLQNRKVSADSQEFNYDYLIICTGAELTFEEVPGLSSAHYYYELEGSERLFTALNGFKGGKVALVIAKPPFKCPAAPYEGALLLDWFFSKKGIRNKTEIKIFTPEALPMPTAGPDVGNQVKELLKQKNISFNTPFKITRVDPAKKQFSFENGHTENCDLLIVIPPHKASSFLKEAGLLSETGWIAVDRNNLKTKFENVYAIGDVTGIPLSKGTFLPKAAVFAISQAEVVADHIVQEISGSKSKQVFPGIGYCYLQVNDKKAGYAIGNFFAEPIPKVEMKKPSLWYHLNKKKFEKKYAKLWF